MTQPATIPRLRGFDHTIRFLRSGYRFIPDACDALHSDRFHARLMLSPVLCARGEDAARMFYGGDHFTRQGAMPPTVLRLLQDKGSVQGLEGAAHRHRKWMFVDLLMGEAQTDSFTALFEEEWLAALQDWASRDEIVLFDEANLVLTRAICRWRMAATGRCAMS
jgi:fatty-acid peroxygenase